LWGQKRRKKIEKKDNQKKTLTLCDKIQKKRGGKTPSEKNSHPAQTLSRGGKKVETINRVR